jgi:squalene-hopene/tetraprenyl-beta-curcumene cyclase
MIDRERLRSALATAREHLLSRRNSDGYWEGRLSSSALATATAISALALAGCMDDRELIEAGIRWLEEDQNPDGGWGDTPDSRSNLATSLLSLSALRIAATSPAGGSPVPGRAPAPRAEAGVIDRAEQYITTLAGSAPADRVTAIKAIYGADRTFAVPILANCALAGLVAWEDIPGLPFELAALPQSWYRAVRLQVVSYALPALIAIGLLLHRRNPRANPLRRALRHVVTGLVRAKLVRLQPENGGFLEATPLTAFTAMSLIDTFGRDEPVAAKCLQFLRASARPDGSWPIDTNLATWATTCALNALAASGGLPGDEAERARRWVAGQQYRHVHPYTGARPGGFGWSDLPGAVPDADDTSGAVLELARSGDTEAVERGVQWLLGLQNSDGGWPTFCRGWGQLPFDQSCADVTAHALRALRAAQSVAGRGDIRAAIARGLAHLQRRQREDGSWAPLWFGNEGAPGHLNPILGTSRVLKALAEFEPDGKEAAWGLAYLIDAQNEDGGWGGDRGVPSSVEETSLAVSALSHWRQAAGEALEAGIGYLVQRVENGTWTRPTPIGLYFASLWYSEELYPVVWAVEALGRAAGD